MDKILPNKKGYDYDDYMILAPRLSLENYLRYATDNINWIKLEWKKVGI